MQRVLLLPQEEEQRLETGSRPVCHPRHQQQDKAHTRQSGSTLLLAAKEELKALRLELALAQAGLGGRSSGQLLCEPLDRYLSYLRGSVGCQDDPRQALGHFQG